MREKVDEREKRKLVRPENQNKKKIFMKMRTSEKRG